MAERDMPRRHVPRGIRLKNLPKHAFVTGAPGPAKSVFLFNGLRRLAVRLDLPMFHVNEEPRDGKSETP